MTRYTVVYLEPLPADVAGIVRSRLPDGFDLVVRQAGEPVEKVLPQADFAIVATTPLPGPAFAYAPRLRLLQHQGVGYNNTDVRAAGERGIPVAVCPVGSSIGVAEHVFLLILALYKRIVFADRSMREGKFYQWDLRTESFEMYGKTMGIVGFGRVGKEVARRARGFGLRLVYSDLVKVAEEVEREYEAKFVSLEDCLSTSDIVTLHLPLTADTRRVIGRQALDRMNPTAILINTARGSLIDEVALVEALQSRRIAGAGLDVFEAEPPPKDHPLFHLENVVLTPHIAAGTVDALIAKMDACFENMQRVVRGEQPVDVVTG